MFEYKIRYQLIAEGDQGAVYIESHPCGSNDTNVALHDFFTKMNYDGQERVKVLSVSLWCTSDVESSSNRQVKPALSN